jgi:hypothetical protein
MSDTEAFEVIGDSPIRGADGKPVTKGGTVRLDPDVTRVDQLIAAGHVKPATKAAEKAADKAAAPEPGK